MTVRVLDRQGDQRGARTVERNAVLWATNAKKNGARGRLNDLSLLWRDEEGPESISVAAGPSLSDDIEDLRKMRQGRELCVVDAALKFVLEAGLTPDFVVTSDASEKVLTMFEGLSIPKTTVLVANVIANPAVIDAWTGGHIHWFVMANQYYSVNHKRMMQEIHALVSGVGTKLVPGGNVSSVALSFLLSVRNSRKVHLFGHDFSWKTDMYAGAAFKHLEAERIAEETAAGTIREVKNSRGDTVLTNQSLARYGAWHERAARLAAGRVKNHTSSTILNIG